MTPMESFIRQYAASIGVDPEIAMRVVLSEGGPESLTDVTRQALGRGPSGQEKSYGPLQMNIEGGLGARALAQNIDPRKASDAYKAVKFGLDVAKKEGWDAWYGADRAGIGDWEGINKIANTGVPRRVGGAGSSTSSFLQTPGIPIPDAAPSSVVASDTPTPKTKTEEWADKLKEIAEGEDASGLVSSLTGEGTESGGSGLYRGDDPIQSILPSLESADTARAQAAQSMMAQLMMPKRRSRGLTLTGVSNA